MHGHAGAEAQAVERGEVHATKGAAAEQQEFRHDTERKTSVAACQAGAQWNRGLPVSALPRIRGALASGVMTVARVFPVLLALAGPATGAALRGADVRAARRLPGATDVRYMLQRDVQLTVPRASGWIPSPCRRGERRLATLSSPCPSWRRSRLDISSFTAISPNMRTKA